MSIYKRFVNDVAIVGIANLFVIFRGLILIPIIAKTLGAHGFGIWAQVAVTLGLIDPIAGLCLNYSFVRFFSGVTRKKDIQEGFFSILIFLLCWSSFISIIIIFLANPISDVFFGDSNTVDIIMIAAIIIPFATINSLSLFFFRTFRQMKTYSALVVFQNVGEIIIITYSIFLGFGVFGAVVSSLIIRIIMCIIMFIIILLQIGLSMPHFLNISSYLKFSIPLIPTQLSSWVVNSGDRYVIGAFMGIAAVGIYSAAYSIGNFIYVFTSVIVIILVPALSKYYDDGNITDVTNLLEYSLKYILMLSIPSAFGVSILSKPILQIIANPEFISSGSSVVPFIASSMILLSICGIVSQVIILRKNTKISGGIWLIAGTTNLCLNIILVPKTGILGAAIGSLIAYAIATILVLYYSSRYLKFNLNYIFILKSIVSSIMMSIIIRYANPVHLIDVSFWIGIGACIYIFTMFILKGFTKREMKFFRELL